MGYSIGRFTKVGFSTVLDTYPSVGAYPNMKNDDDRHNIYEDYHNLRFSIN